MDKERFFGCMLKNDDKINKIQMTVMFQKKIPTQELPPIFNNPNQVFFPKIDVSYSSIPYQLITNSMNVKHDCTKFSYIFDKNQTLNMCQ